MLPYTFKPRRRLRLPQLNKANRIARRKSEFVVMCERIAQADEHARNVAEWRRYRAA